MCFVYSITSFYLFLQCNIFFNNSTSFKNSKRKDIEKNFIIRRFKYNNLLIWNSTLQKYIISFKQENSDIFFFFFLLHIHFLFQIKFLHNQVNQTISPLFSRIWGGSHVFPLLRQPSTLMSHNFFNFQNERGPPLSLYY